jgi:serine/threonine-protein kinase
MNTPSPKFFCPKCSAAYDRRSKYCGQCGADMLHGSALDYAARTERLEGSSTSDTRALDSDDAPNTPSEEWKPKLRSSSRTTDEWLGRIVDDRYHVLEVIGRGGMGVVYKVEHQRMGKIAAMKVLHTDLATDPEVIGRFRREAEAVSRLNHPNTVQVFDFGESYGALYLIMEFVRGQDLGTLIKRDGAMPFDRAAPLVAQICAALREAHDLGIVHRDLKPENILVTRTHRGRDFVKVLDFGLAKLTEREELAEVTDRGSIVGTPYYMSPEQIRGEDVDPRSDIYSLGGLMFRVMTGQHAFTAKTPVGVLTKHLTAEVDIPSERCPELRIAEEVDDIILQALEKDPADRYQRIEDMVDDLEAVFMRTNSESSPIGMPTISWSGARQVSDSRPMTEDEVDYGMGSSVRLRRSDLDDYERSMRRRRRVRIALVPLVLAAMAAAVAYLYFFQAPKTYTEEIESNNEARDATRIAENVDVIGYIGKRASKTAPDRDYFEIKYASPAEGRAMTIVVKGVPNMDIEIALVDPRGKVLATRNEGGVGHSESIHGVRVRGEVLVMVTQTDPGPRLPVENVSDAYTLRVSTEPVHDGIETEPNESITDATSITVGAPVQGFVDRRADIDTYRFDGAAGSYKLELEGAPNAALTWRVGKGTASNTRAGTATLEPGSAIVIERNDRARPAGQQLPGVDEPYTLVLESN